MRNVGLFDKSMHEICAPKQLWRWQSFYGIRFSANVLCCSFKLGGILDTTDDRDASSSSAPPIVDCLCWSTAVGEMVVIEILSVRMRAKRNELLHSFSSRTGFGQDSLLVARDAIVRCVYRFKDNNEQKTWMHLLLNEVCILALLALSLSASDGQRALLEEGGCQWQLLCVCILNSMGYPWATTFYGFFATHTPRKAK